MGVFSYKCALSGIEIAGPISSDYTPKWMNRIVIFHEGKAHHGNYDGYGRIHTDDGEEIDFHEETLQGPAGEAYRKANEEWHRQAMHIMRKEGIDSVYDLRVFGKAPPEHGVELPEPKVILERFYKGQKEEDVPYSESADWQGWYIPQPYLDAVEALAQTYEEKGIKAPQGGWEEDDEEEEEDFLESV